MPTLRLAPDLYLPLEVVTETVAILAKRRSGKSYTARKLVEQLLAAGLQVVVVDPKGDWWGLRSSADGKNPGYPVLIAGGEHGDVPLEAGAGEVLARFVVEQRVGLLLDLSSFRKHEVATFMTGFLETVYRLKAQEQYRTPMMLAIDEADAIAPQRPQRGEERMLGAAEDIVRRGGQRGIGCTLISQRSAVLNKNVLTQAQVLIALRTMSPQDLAALDAWIEVHGTPAERRVLMESLPSLPVGDAWVWSPGWPTDAGIFQRIHVAPIETFDSGATPKPGQKVTPPKALADVDLGALTTAMAATIEKAKADDPRELRRRIAELERQIASKPATAPLETKVERVEVPVLTQEQVTALVRIGADAQVTATNLRDAADKLLEASGQILGALVNARPGEAMRHRPAQPPPQREPVPRIDPVPTAHKRPATANAPAPRPERQAAVTAPQQRILDALAAFEAAGLADVAKSNVAVFAGQSSTSSGFANNLGALRSAGLIAYPSGGRVALTDLGRSAAAPTETIRSVEQLHEAWRAKLSAPQWRILQVLISRFPGALARAAVAEESGQSATSSGFANNLGALRSLGLLDYPTNGMVAATDLLFPALARA